jgi:hypothetical protein
MWKNPIPALLVAAAALTGAMGTAHAGNVTWSVGIQAGPPVVYGPPPVYMAPPPVYVAPPPPVYYAPPPRVVYGAPPVVMWGPAPPLPGWRHHHHRRHDRGDWDGGGRYRR